METPRETNGEPQPIRALLDTLGRAWGIEFPDLEQIKRRDAAIQAARRARGPAYADCVCLGAGGTGDELGVFLERDPNGDPIVALVGDQVVYRWEHICPCPDGWAHREHVTHQRGLAADQLRAKRVRKLLGAAGIDDYPGFTIDSWLTVVDQVLGADGLPSAQDDARMTAVLVRGWCADMWAGRDRSVLLLAGGYGTGKSGLGAAVVAEWVGNLKTALFRSAGTIAAELRAAPYRVPEDDDGTCRTWDRVIAAYQDADLLVIDDLGGESMTTGSADTVREVLFTIVDGRMVAKRPTVITTNRPRDQIATRYGERLADRLDSRFVRRIWMDGPNLRAERAQT